ncbi:MAG: V-type ATPase subunit [Candidatus Micrarchaeota archaeon]
MSLEFEYATTRVKGMKSKLLSEGRMRQLLEVRSIPEMIGLLEESDYKEEFVAESTKYSGMELMMRALQENFKDDLQRLVRINPDAGKAALKILLQEYEIQNISKLITAKAAEIEAGEIEFIILDPQQEKMVTKLNSAKNLPELLRKLKNTEYGKAMQKVSKEFEKTGDFRVPIRAMNEYYYDKLQSLEPSGNNLLWKLIDSRNSMRNLMIVLRVKKADPSADAMKFLFQKDDRFLKQLNALSDFGKILERVAQKHLQVAGAVEACQKQSSLIPLEIALERGFIRDTLRLLQFAVLDFAAILGYLYLKELEVAAIRKIAYAKQYGFTDELKGMIFSFNA